MQGVRRLAASRPVYRYARAEHPDWSRHCLLARRKVLYHSNRRGLHQCLATIWATRRCEFCQRLWEHIAAPCHHSRSATRSASNAFAGRCEPFGAIYVERLGCRHTGTQIVAFQRQWSPKRKIIIILHHLHRLHIHQPYSYDNATSYHYNATCYQ